MACQTYSLHATREEHTKLPKQTGALPWRKTSGKDLEVLLVTGRRSGVWMIPKGWPIRGKSLAKAAAQEAFEEAGVEGTVDPKPIGSFRHIKQNLGVGTLEVSIAVHPLAVDRELASWPEHGQRERRWFKLSEAADQVTSPELAGLIRDLKKRVRGS
jgi:ADP-ribose pyrophosphatase YjhB (NUDIX family)